MLLWQANSHIFYISSGLNSRVVGEMGKCISIPQRIDIISTNTTNMLKQFEKLTLLFQDLISALNSKLDDIEVELERQDRILPEDKPNPITEQKEVSVDSSEYLNVEC